MHTNSCTDETLLLNLTLNAAAPESGHSFDDDYFDDDFADESESADDGSSVDFIQSCQWMPLYKSTSPCARWGASLTPRNDDRDKVYLFGGQRSTLCLNDLWLVRCML